MDFGCPNDISGAGMNARFWRQTIRFSGPRSKIHTGRTQIQAQTALSEIQGWRPSRSGPLICLEILIVECTLKGLVFSDIRTAYLNYTQYTIFDYQILSFLTNGQIKIERSYT